MEKFCENNNSLIGLEKYWNMNNEKKISNCYLNKTI